MIFRRRKRLPDQKALARAIEEMVRAELLAEQETTPTGPLNFIEALDSIRILHLCAMVEKRYGIKIEDDEITVDHFSGPESLARLLLSKSRG